MASKTNQNSTSHAIVAVSLELLAVGLFTVMAGFNDEMGTIVILLMVGFWMIYLIQNSKVLAGLEKAMVAANG